MKAKLFSAGFVALLISGIVCVAQPAGPATRTAKLRVGVYDSRAVAVAYGRSGAMEPALKDLKSRHDEAKKKGDDKLAKQLEAEGANSQTLRHLQAFSNAPVDDIMSTIKEKLPAIASDSGVDVIVARTDYQAGNVETVDVTDRIVSLFNPDEKTSQMIQDLRKREPYPMVQILGMKE